MIFYKASENGRIELVKESIESGANIEVKDKYGNNSLINGNLNYFCVSLINYLFFIFKPLLWVILK